MTNPKLCEKISPNAEVNAKRLGMFKTGDVHQAKLALNREGLNIFHQQSCGLKQ